MQQLPTNPQPPKGAAGPRQARPSKAFLVSREVPSTPLKELAAQLQLDQLDWLQVSDQYGPEKAVLSKLLSQGFDTVIVLRPDILEASSEGIDAHVERTQANRLDLDSLDQLLPYWRSQFGLETEPSDESQEQAEDDQEALTTPGGRPVAYFHEVLGQWQPISHLAEALGCSRTRIDLALREDRMLDGLELQDRRATNSDRKNFGSARLKFLVRLRGRPDEALLAQMEAAEQERQRQQEMERERERRQAQSQPVDEDEAAAALRRAAAAARAANTELPSKQPSTPHPAPTVPTPETHQHATQAVYEEDDDLEEYDGVDAYQEYDDLEGYDPTEEYDDLDEYDAYDEFDEFDELAPTVSEPAAASQLEAGAELPQAIEISSLSVEADALLEAAEAVVLLRDPDSIEALAAKLFAYYRSQTLS